jgi:4-amino-4-deoxy-L-arabinose transferase-like glycosyltransferase
MYGDMNFRDLISGVSGERRRDSAGNKADMPPEQRVSFVWYSVFLFLLLLLSAALAFWHLGSAGYSNLYYAAGVRSMVSSKHNFFFAAYDPGGYISLDKPPVDFWFQVVSAKIFGFSPWSLLLPQALAGVLSVALLAHLVRRRFGSLAALLAALALALTPISVITSRNNDVDSLLVLLLLLAAWAVILAAEQGNWRWLLLSMGFVGVGFNTKWLRPIWFCPLSSFSTFLPRRDHGAPDSGTLSWRVGYCSWCRSAGLSPLILFPPRIVHT